MQPAIMRFAASLFALIPTGAVPQDAAPAKTPIEQVRARVLPALVNISVVTRYFEEGRAHRAPSGGSGVIVTKEGHVITNYHVASHATRIWCTLSSGETIEAVVVAHDPETDLSVLRLKTEKRKAGSLPISCAVLGDSDRVQVGDTVFALGNPLMLASSTTMGIVSNKERVFTDFGGNELEEQTLDTGEETGGFTRWIQHDAMILPGNSGGPLVNHQGEVIGINELGGGGMGFAIPSRVASSVLRQVLAAGKVRRAWAGLKLFPVQKLGLSDGALVESVTPGSPAEKAGILPGDILRSIGGQSVVARFFEEVPPVYQRIAELEIGKPAPIVVVRDQERRELIVTPVAMERSIGEEDEVRSLGVTVEEITAAMQIEEALPTRDGVRVTGVRPGKPAESAHPKIQEGDILFAVNRAPVKDLRAFRAAVRAGGGDDLLVAFRRGEEFIVTILKPDKQAEEDDDTELPKPWLGAKTQVVTPELAAALQLGTVKGYRVTHVYAGSRALDAGLAPGDILVSLNGAKLTASREQDAEDLTQAIEALSVGEKAEIGILRQGKPRKIAIQLEPTPASVARAKKARQEEFEFAVREIGRMDRMETSWLRKESGLLVTEVTPGGWAGIAGLYRGDVLISANGARLADAKSFQEAMKSLVEARPPLVKLLVKRRSKTHFVLLEPDWDRLLPVNGEAEKEKPL